MRYLKISWIVLVTLMRLGGVALSLFLLVISAGLRLPTAVIGTVGSEDEKWPDIETSNSDDAFVSLTSFKAKRPRIF